jgi:tRNA nucleotidyltransferase (CCA-adding enzyme)
MAGFLLTKGADLNSITDFINPELSQVQLKLLDKLTHAAKILYVNNVKIVITGVKLDKYCSDLALLAHKIRDLENLNVLFVLAEIKNKVYITARSRVEEVNVNEIMRVFGGGGHRWAASASVKDVPMEKVIEELKTVLKEKVREAPTAREIMTSPVKSVREETSINEARKIMLRYNNNSLPVINGKKLTGIITSYDIDKAVHHGFGSMPVREYMTTQVITIKPGTSLDKIHEIMLENDIGHLPVMERGRILGMVSRSDLLAIMHHRGLNGARERLPVQSTLRVKKIRRLLDKSLPRRIDDLLKKIGETARRNNFSAYVVGGFVRDLLLGVENLDVDIVVEGNGIEFAQALAAELGGAVKTHEQFVTAVVTLPDGFKIDIATARTEFYEFPAALPKVASSSIKEDMYRRDFTINAMAVKLNPDGFGELIDYFGGWQDLKNKKIKVLYNLSFVEDPTRIFRAIRFEQRYHFTMDKDTEKFIQGAIAGAVFDKLTDERVREELILIFSEDDPWRATQRLAQFDLLRFIHPRIKLSGEMEAMFSEMQDNLFVFTLPLADRVVHKWLVYFLILIDELKLKDIEGLIERFRFTREESLILLRAKTPEQALAERISAEEKLAPSVMYDYFVSTPVEVLLYQMARARSSFFKKRTADFLNRLSKVKLSLTGDDLKALGYAPGPQFRDILKALLKARLDGTVKSKEEEIQFVVDNYAKN